MHILSTLVGLLAVPQPSGPVAWTTASSIGSDGSVRVEIIAHVEEGWHIYATELPSDEGPIATSFRFSPSSAYVTLGELQEPKPVEEYDDNFAMVVRHHSGEPRFVLAIKPAVSEAFVVEGEVEYMVCNDKTCLPPVVVPFRITVPAS